MMMPRCRICLRRAGYCECLPAAPSAPGPQTAADTRYWLIHFDDAERENEVFTSEASARARFDEANIAWNCTLFAQASGRAAADTHTEALRDARAAFERIVSVGTTPLDSMRPVRWQMQEMGDEMLRVARRGLAALAAAGGEEEPNV